MLASHRDARGDINDRAYDIVDVMRTIATAHRVSMSQVALAWLLAQEVVTSVIRFQQK